jgi:putative salt-induced outer membrane protein
MRPNPFLVVATVLCASPFASAQLQSGTTTSSTASVSSGKTDVAKEGFSTAEKAEKKKGITEVSFNAGGLFAAGNSRSAAVTAGLKTKVKRGEHQFTGAAAANYAASGTPGNATQTTVENLQAMLRYDWFVLKKVSIFLQTSARRDRFQGLDLRYNLGPGAAYYFIQEDKAQLWGEAGYDFQYDVRRDDFLVNPDGTPKLDADGNPLGKTQVVHNARAFLGFDDKLFKGVEFLASAEYLQDLTDGNTYRFIFDSAVKASISKAFALATSVTVRFENNPLPGVQNTDVTTALSLVYNMF